jgi:hypothetical protein
VRDLRAIYQGKEKYIWASDSLNELYDLEKDLGELQNLIAKFPRRAQALDKTLMQWVASIKPLKTKGEKVKISRSTEEKLRALGYVK